MAYDFKKNNIIINGEHMVVGLASGTPFAFALDEDRVTKVVGAKGEVSHAITNNNSGTITITLLHTSTSNSYLENQINKKITIAVVDGNNEGAVNATAKDCYIQTVPDLERGTEISERAWVISVPELIKN